MWLGSFKFTYINFWGVYIYKKFAKVVQNSHIPFIQFPQC